MQHSTEVSTLAGLYGKMEDRAKLLHEEQLKKFGIDFGKLPLAGLYVGEQVVAGTKQLLHGCLNNYANTHIPDDAPAWLEEACMRSAVD